MAVDTTQPSFGQPAPEAAYDDRTPAIKIWAGIGALFLILGGYIIIHWISSPYFEPVPQGPSEPPTWMKVTLIGWQVLSFPAAFTMFWFLVIRPWRRTRTVGVDGLFLVAGGTLFVQDVWSNAGNHWFTYNTYMVNFGSWLHSVPWANSYGEPGAMLSEPILFIPAAYTYIMVFGAGVGCWAMKKLKARRPKTSTVGIIAFGFVVMFAFDVVLEGFIWMPMGIYEFPGGWGFSLFPDTYHKFPLNEPLTIGAVFTLMAALKYFRDDRGLTVVERGLDRLTLSPGKSVLLRMVAMIGFVNLAMFLFYNVPNTAVGFNSHEWPEDLQKRSYFTDGLCGEGTDRACPGGSNPHITHHSVYPSTNGGVTRRPGVEELPGIVPFDRGEPGGDE